MPQQVQLLGVGHAVQVLETLPKKIHKKVLPKAVRAGGTPLLKSARKLAPRANRLLARSLVLVLRRYSGAVVAIIGQEKTKRFDKAKTKIRRRGGISGRGELTPLHLVEENVSPHAIRPRSARAARSARLVFRVGGKTVYASQVAHPGRRGDHFILRAASSTQRQAVQAFEQKLTTETFKEAAAGGPR
jgi:hypothetical protein